MSYVVLYVGVYLLFLSIADAEFRGKYCLKSNEWLTGYQCKSLGVLAVLSSQSSVLTLVALSTVRLITVLDVSIIKCAITSVSKTVFLLKGLNGLFVTIQAQTH